MSSESCDDSEAPRPLDKRSDGTERDDFGDSDTDSHDHASRLVHESLKGGGEGRRWSTRGQKHKYVPEDETPDAKDARTIFVGNVTADVVKSRPLMKQLKRHILGFVPGARIESTRCRSVAFQAPTSKLPAFDVEDAVGGKGKGKQEGQKQVRQHEVQRASLWRDSKASKEEDEITKDEKKYLTPQEKKKIAFIHRDLHPGVDTVNVYVVFAYPTPRAKAAETMDPFEAARLSVQRCNGSVFSGHTLRVDRVGKAKTTNTGDSAAEDPKTTLFVGNLDFACKEDDLRAFFEALMISERGAPASDVADVPEELVGKSNAWVTRIRIIRDKDTQLGKGFAYVQFADRTCVDEILGLDETKLKFAKRKLRVQRCKTSLASHQLVAGYSARRVGGGKSSETQARSGGMGQRSNLVPAVPKGNPALGEKIAHLPKEARKQAKASDPDRVARRMAKKKARMALINKGTKPQATERERIRKRPKAKPGSDAGKESKKRRVRSDKSILNKNMKK
ncbi:hypothetical protein GLOTRDRAFT_49630 [Gloeophyllum trabeum ATCC 11539]|uniref:Nucleolar protein 12 n=1 Tax=Gloeophyllum trabeum (strain ATCC 11539 / FP-39264 / Madison 617) TaxID=670483 RepID=S7PT11_GLOTA|nr:uncharacterized protein GLOTRDRAFT_49630 [Gloeophyllum trabeum ATCC 11539]EPQ50956.1 hypothetical protein GLOTRDRAFT_49630 [Gloeophyllum trabeum ATCC 11539]